MSAITTTPDTSKDSLLIPLASAFVITFFLFFIDEGYYDLRWMMNWGNWIVFVVYFVFLFPVQWAISTFMFSKFQDAQKALLMLLIGIPITLALFYWIVL
jgi:hypothetical protein